MRARLMHNPARRCLKKLTARLLQISYVTVHSSQEEETEATCLPLTHQQSSGQGSSAYQTMAFFISNLSIPSIQIQIQWT